ncbi:hypothetical protein M404DRAFT_669471 [Pisolithus tinctorius Marx 270]|uniref:Uncharacterized protein n=1 Tax=Pisolithus tinctorius Marx 270 TaxID=870435 RepID=A0A0C3J030_PISTI|nr:hypothetical protein M404DRAFT_669471 [Pisolithus tinctorius Marx 270]
MLVLETSSSFSQQRAILCNSVSLPDCAKKPQFNQSMDVKYIRPFRGQKNGAPVPLRRVHAQSRLSGDAIRVHRDRRIGSQYPGN